MKIKKSLSLKSLALVATLIASSSEAVFAKDIDPAIQEQVIQEIVAESRQDLTESQTNPFVARSEKVILKGYWDAKSRSFIFKPSSKAQLIENLRIAKLPMAEREDFLNTRNMILNGISAGGIIYFIPGSKVVFWETEKNQLDEDQKAERFWTNPFLGGFLSRLLAYAQTEIQNDREFEKISPTIKSVTMMVLNPASILAGPINKIRGQKDTVGQTQISTESPMPKETRLPPEYAPTNYIGVNFTFRF